MIEAIFQGILRGVAYAILDRLGERKAVRYRRRNAAGQCALCSLALAREDLCHVPYRGAGTAEMRLEVCTRCVTYLRRERIVVWTALTCVVALVLLEAMTHR